MLSGRIQVLLQGRDKGSEKYFPDSHCLAKVLTRIIFLTPPRNNHLLQFSTRPNLWGLCGEQLGVGSVMPVLVLLGKTDHVF